MLRNRAAAQSSRERKRQEVEKLEGEKSTIEQQNQWLKDRIMAVEHEKFLLGQKLRHVTSQLSSLKDGSSTSSSSGGSSASSPEPDMEEESFDHIKIKQEIEEHTTFAFSTQPTFSSPSSMTYSPSVSPSQPSLSFDDSSLATSPDLTQHPAEMLWFDLQCQSAEVRSPRKESPRSQVSDRQIPKITTMSTPSSSATSTMTSTLFLLLASTLYSQLVTPFFHSLTNRPRRTSSTTTITLRSQAATRTTSPLSSRKRISRSTPWSTLTPRPRPTKQTSSFIMSLELPPCYSRQAPQVNLNRRNSRVHSLFLSSPPLARPLKDATGRTLRGQASYTASRFGGNLPRVSRKTGRSQVCSKGSFGDRLVIGQSVRSSIGRGEAGITKKASSGRWQR